jgi:hypothetical protein
MDNDNFEMNTDLVANVFTENYDLNEPEYQNTTIFAFREDKVAKEY